MLARGGPGKSARRIADEIAENRGAVRECLFTRDFLRLARCQAGDACVLGMKYCCVDMEGIGGVKILGLQGIEWAILGDHSGGKACG